MSVEQSVAPQRRHVVEGVYNLRDTGGYPAATGTSRWGRLLRSDALHRLDDPGRALLAELGVAHIVDLRGAAERGAARSLVDGLDATVHRLPVFDDAEPAAQAIGAVALAPLYDHIVDDRGAQLVEAVRVIASAAAGQAVLVHCTAGKDRTGLVVALALRAAGVEREAVVADYAETAEHLRGEWAEQMLRLVTGRGVELTPQVVELITASPAPVMAALLERLERTHGSVAGYLLANGLTADELGLLTTALISTD